MFLRRTQRRRGRSVAFVKQIEGVHGRAIDFLRVGQNAFLSFQALVFAGLQLGVFNLALLEGPQIEQTQAILLSVFQFVDAVSSLLPEGKCLGRGFELCTGESIEQIEPRRSIERKHRFVLRMNGREIWRELAQHGNRGRLIVDEDASLAAGRNFAPQDDGFVFWDRCRWFREFG